jgi:hypothetical protein
VPVANLPEEEERAAAVAAIDDWSARELASDGALVADERQQVTDRTATHRLYLRFKGEEKDFITVWLTLNQRTLHHEAQFMPAPEENKEAVFQYLLRRNGDLYQMSFCLGPEDAVYLVGRVAAAEVNDDELDRITGSSIHYVDEHFPTAMTLGYPGLYRRRPRRGAGGSSS